MKPEKQNWTISDVVAGELDPQTMSPYDGVEHLFIHRPNGDYECLDYTSDLNAMHEAEKVLSNNQWLDYVGALNQNVAATAAQRAEAFLKTLNLWTDDWYETN